MIEMGAMVYISAFTISSYKYMSNRVYTNTYSFMLVIENQFWDLFVIQPYCNQIGLVKGISIERSSNIRDARKTYFYLKQSSS